ncbi:MAG TPA: DUF559 domain-containing protein [Stellaceae bacterium]|nr:DUF559 domain-containing protein [Stellaceae bacterium]
MIDEIDGGQHDLSSYQETRRTRFLENEGYRVLRFWTRSWTILKACSHH